ncbi:ATP-binding protein [Streptomyces sp. NPDC059009]|uniref:HAMP domain-containing sensor histidine kinase n=1 Tax=Streptomyces sp. NPDC059009 TaxID=3346694 RepID=UPI0036A76B73
MTRVRAALARLLPARCRSLRWKIAATVTAVSCTAAAVLGVTVHDVVSRHAVGAVRAEAAASLGRALSAYAYGGSLNNSRALLDPAELPAELRALALRGDHGSMPGTYRGEDVMWAAAPADDHVVAAQVPYDDTLRYLAAMDTAIFGAALLAAGAVTCAGLLIARRISRRLDATAAVARRISEGDLDARTRVAPERDGAQSGDEVAAVATALDTMASSLRERLLTEQRFTADVAHELRTPLTGCLAAAGLLPEGRPKEMINDRLQALHRLTEDLLEISRLDSGGEQPELSSCQLGPAVAQFVRATGLDTTVRVHADATVRTDRRRLERVLANLVVNAHRHGRPPVVVTVDGPHITVRDHGPGYPRAILDHGAQRFLTGAPDRAGGHGLGLTIASGHAHVLGLTLTLRNAPDGGAIATLRLPAEVAGGEAPTTASGALGRAHPLRCGS